MSHIHGLFIYMVEYGNFRAQFLMKLLTRACPIYGASAAMNPATGTRVWLGKKSITNSTNEKAEGARLFSWKKIHAQFERMRQNALKKP